MVLHRPVECTGVTAEVRTSPKKPEPQILRQSAQFAIDTVGLGPIGWCKRNMPEARCGLCKFQGHLRRSNRRLLDRDHATLQMFPTAHVLHKEPLPRYH